MGAWSEVDLNEHTIQLHPGDAVVAYTDGVVECTDEEGRMFDVRRVVQVVNSESSGSAGELLGAILKRVQSFTGNQPQPDDLTVLVLKVEG